jgi:hypothetical protein
MKCDQGGMYITEMNSDLIYLEGSGRADKNATRLPTPMF